MGQLVSQEIPHMVGGVSQQAPAMRLDTQCEAQVNCWNSLVSGLSPRPTTKRIGASLITSDEAYIMDYHRDDNEHYRIALNNDGGQKLKVFDGKVGTEYPVDISSELENQLNITGGTLRDVPYLNPIGNMTHREAFQLLPIKDSVLILNRTYPTKRVIGNSADDAEPTSTEYRRYRLSIQAIEDTTDFYRGYLDDDGTFYKFNINGNTYKYTLGNSATASSVAARLATQLTADFPEFDAGAIGASVYVTVAPDFEVSVSESSQVKFVAFDFDPEETKTLTVSSETFSVTTGVTGRPNFEALLWVRQADYAVNYNVTINGNHYNVKTPDTTADGARDGLRTESIATSLATEVDADVSVTAVSKGNVVHVSSADDFTLDSSDSLGGSAMASFKRNIMSEQDLPGENAPSGYKVQVRGDVGGSNTNGYWLEYDNSNSSQGIWAESSGFASENKFDLKTLPLLLNRRQDISRMTDDNPSGIFFELTVTPWKDRIVGDEDSAPFPSFLSEQNMEDASMINPRSITAMGLHQNRLVLASGDTMMISEVNQFFNLFPTTVATEVVSDAIEVSLDTNDVVNIKHMTPGAGALVLWTDRKQYVLQQNEVFTSGSIKARMATADEVDLSIEPQAVGNRIYFVSDRGKYKTVKEFFAIGDGYQFDTEDVTAHVPEYIEGNIIKMVGNTSINALFILTTGDNSGGLSNTIYVYNYFDKSNERVQSAWSKWEFNGDVIDLSINNTQLSFLIKRKTGTDTNGGAIFQTYLETIELAYDELEQFHGHPVFLDSYAYRDTEYLPADLKPGEVTKAIDGRFYKGYPINVLYEFSPFQVRDRDGTAYSSGRLQLKRLNIQYYDTTNFIFEVETLARETRTRLFQGRVLGRFDNLIGKVPVTTGRYSAPIMGRSGAVKVRIRNNEIYGFKFQSATWEGFFNQRSKRL